MYPNPVLKGSNTVLFIPFTQSNAPATIVLIDATGKKLLQQNVTLRNGKNEFVINTATFSGGVCFIIVNTKTGKQQYKLILQ